MVDKASGLLSANTTKDATAAIARDVGYVIPPSSSNPSFLNKALEGFAGKLSTAQKASSKNQEVTNRLVASELGIPEGVKISREVLNGVRREAGQAYETVKGLGTIAADKKYIADLDGIVSQARNVDRSFPGLGGNQLEDVAKSLRQENFNAADAVDAIKLLRQRADKFYATGDKEMGGAFKNATTAIEDMLERAAESSGKPEILAQYLNARATIAKSYSVEKALNDATGNVSAQKLGIQLSKGKPLSGDVKKAAQFGAQFPKASREINESLPGISPLDYALGVALGTASGNYGLILSKPYQALMTAPKYDPKTGRLLNSAATRELLRSGLLGATPEFVE
jgi:hypothetical protein